MTTRHLFIASLGNPPPHHKTLHSAGHILLARLSRLPPPPSWHLHASKTQMNVSGPPILAAYNRWLARLPSAEERADARLVVLHDELELPLGRVRVKAGGSARGHNGLKSLVGAGGEKVGGGKGMVRVGVGIGRPESRESGDVSNWVLRGMTGREREAIGGEGVVGSVVRLLERL